MVAMGISMSALLAVFLIMQLLTSCSGLNVRGLPRLGSKPLIMKVQDVPLRDWKRSLKVGIASLWVAGDYSAGGRRFRERLRQHRLLTRLRWGHACCGNARRSWQLVC